MSTPHTMPIETSEMRAASTFLETFYLREEAHPDRVYLRQPFGHEWRQLTWAEVGEQARRMAAALHEMGLKKGDHVGLISKNCYHWIIADLAILMGGFVSVPYYATLPARDLEQVIELSHIKALFVGKVDNWANQKDGVPSSLPTIAFPHYAGNSKIDATYNWDDLIAKHEPLSNRHEPEPEDIFTIIYTSGTTGSPKGVMITYDAINQIAKHEREANNYGIFTGNAERLFSYLPLNHIGERAANELTSIMAGSSISFGESLETFADNIQSVQPTLLFAVPRILTKFQQAALEKIPEKRLNTLLKIPIINNIIKRKLREGFGMGEVKAMLSGAAPLPAATLEWYQKIGVNIQEVYGASETSGGVTANRIDEITAGSIGKPLHGVDIKLDPVTDEILIKCPWNMIGYYGAPEKSAEVLKDGYYHSGDTGRWDENGNLFITGRIKDTFKTAKGKYILPVPIENRFAGNLHVGQIMVTGLGLPQPIGLICLSDTGMEAEPAEVEASLHQTLEEINSEIPSYQKISCLVIQNPPWDETSGYMTPTLKLKRHLVDKDFSPRYEAWSKSGKKVIWA